jgi:phosphoenolpyruvate synthase/pyruvate phosphate dikinase
MMPPATVILETDRPRPVTVARAVCVQVRSILRQGPGYEHVRGVVAPLHVLDQPGVGKLITLAVAAGKSVRPQRVVGIRGEHGGEPRSVTLVHASGLDYVSCSPYRVPVARLAADHAALDPTVQ